MIYSYFTHYAGSYNYKHLDEAGVRLQERIGVRPIVFLYHQYRDHEELPANWELA